MKAILLFLILTFLPLTAHEGHMHLSDASADAITVQSHTNTEQWFIWLGNFHYLTNHFPIALIIMTAIAEILFWLRGKNIYEYAALFMLISAAIIVIPNALFGLAQSFAENYDGPQQTYFTFHASLGFLTSLLTILAVAFRISHYRSSYLITLTIATITVSLTGLYGGFLSFGTGILNIPLL
jgi:uncharacterized membrane protein